MRSSMSGTGAPQVASRTHAGLGLALVAVALGLGGCESARFGGSRPAAAATRPSAGFNAPDPVTTTVPSGSVVSEPLPPPGGAAPPSVVASAGPPPTVVDVPPPAAVAPVAPSAPSRSTAVGGWTAADATGASCRINLSSSPALDLYRASASGCANKDLGRVTAWDFRDGEVYLYQPGGAVAARLRGSSASLSGVLTKSGAPLTMSR